MAETPKTNALMGISALCIGVVSIPQERLHP